MQHYTFVTLSSGIVIEVPLDFKPTRLSGIIWNLIKARGGAIPGAPVGWTVGMSAMEGAIYFSIHFGEEIIAAGAVVADKQLGEELWGLLEELHLKTYEVVSAAIGNAISDSWLGNPTQPTETPWVGLVFQPDIMAHPEATQWIQAFVATLANSSLPVLLVA